MAEAQRLRTELEAANSRLAAANDHSAATPAAVDPLAKTIVSNIRHDRIFSILLCSQPNRGLARIGLSHLADRDRAAVPQIA